VKAIFTVEIEFPKEDIQNESREDIETSMYDQIMEILEDIVRADGDISLYTEFKE